MSTFVTNLAGAVNSLSQWRDYLELTKPKVVALLVFTAVVGMLMATPGSLPWNALIFGTLGIGLCSASAAAINHFIDQRADAEMARTRARPLPQGTLTSTQVLTFAVSIGVLGMAILLMGVNQLTAWLTFASLIGYAIIYTVYLKRATPQNIVIGGAAGAAPPVLGWTAVTDSLDPHALLLFLIVFVWTPPHFWALAIHRRDDYAKVEIPMLPVTHGVQFTRLHVLLYTILLFVITLLPYLTGMNGLLYLAGAVVLGLVFLFYAWKLYSSADRTWPMRTFGFSILYLFLLFAFLLVDRYLPFIIAKTRLFLS